MKIPAVVLLLLLTACYTQNPDVAEQKKAIADLLNKQVTAWNEGNIKGFMEGYMRDSAMQFISKNGLRRGWQQTLDAYIKHYPDKKAMGKLEFKLDTIEFLDRDAAYGHIAGKWRLYRTADTPSGYFSLITRRTPEGPRIIIDHTW